MSFLDQVGVLLLTFNDASNIGRMLQALDALLELEGL